MKRVSPNLTTYARQLRIDMTEVEKRLWRQLRMRQLHGLKFRRQHPCGPYILDFACLEIKLAIELDGGQHAAHIDDDEARTDWLNQEGWKVLRFWNNEVADNMHGVLEKISDVSRDWLPPSHPSR